MAANVRADRLHTTLLAAGIAVTGVSLGVLGNRATYVVAPANLQAAAQPAIDAFDDTDEADTAWANTQARTQASSAIDNDHTSAYKTHRAVASVLVDELNILRQWDMSLKAAVAASTTLADLKTRVAALPNLADRTLVQAKQAIQAVINAGTVD